MQQAQNTFRAIADPTRRSIIALLSKKDMTIAEVSSHFDMTRAAVKKHLIILEEGDLISVHPKGREKTNRLEPAALKNIADWLAHFDHFWDEKLNNLTHAIETQKDKT